MVVDAMDLVGSAKMPASWSIIRASLSQLCHSLSQTSRNSSAVVARVVLRGLVVSLHGFVSVGIGHHVPAHPTVRQVVEGGKRDVPHSTDVAG